MSRVLLGVDFTGAVVLDTEHVELSFDWSNRRCLESGASFVTAELELESCVTVRSFRLSSNLSIDEVKRADVSSTPTNPALITGISPCDHGGRPSLQGLPYVCPAAGEV